MDKYVKYNCSLGSNQCKHWFPELYNLTLFKNCMLGRVFCSHLKRESFPVTPKQKKKIKKNKEKDKLHSNLRRPTTRNHV